MEDSMNGKIVMITGANSGIGFETTLGLAKMGAEIIMVCRNPEKGKEALEEIKSKSGNTNIHLMITDFASLESVRKLAKDFADKYQRLDVLVNNAGFVADKRRLTVDGYESTFAVNYLAPFLLTNLLLPILKKSGKARIVNVASDAHKMGHIDFDDLMSEKNQSMINVYGNSKIAVILFTSELARRLEGTGITVNSLHPGVVHSNFASNGPSTWKLFFKYGSMFLITPEKGAVTSIYLASSSEVEGVTGKYFDKCKPVNPSREAQDKDEAHKLWEVTEKLVSLSPARA